MSVDLKAKITLSAKDKATPSIKKMGAEIESLKKKITQLNKQQKKTNELQIESTGGMRGFVRGAAAVAATVGTAAVGLIKMGEAGSNAAWELRKNAEMAGFQVENYQRWTYAIESYTNMSEEGFRRATRALGGLITQARKDPASDIAKAFKSTGVALKDAEGNATSLNEVLLDIAGVYDRIAKTRGVEAANSQLKKFMGNRAFELAGLFKYGKQGMQETLEEASKYRNIKNDKELTKREEAGYPIWELQESYKKAKGKLMGATINEAGELAKELNKLLQVSEPLIISVTKGITNFLSHTIEQISIVIDGVTKAVSWISGTTGSIWDKIKGAYAEEAERTQGYRDRDIAAHAGNMKNSLPNYKTTEPNQIDQFNKRLNPMLAIEDFFKKNSLSKNENKEPQKIELKLTLDSDGRITSASNDSSSKGISLSVVNTGLLNPR